MKKKDKDEGMEETAALLRNARPRNRALALMLLLTLLCIPYVPHVVAIVYLRSNPSVAFAAIMLMVAIRLLGTVNALVRLYDRVKGRTS